MLGYTSNTARRALLVKATHQLPPWMHPAGFDPGRYDDLIENLVFVHESVSSSIATSMKVDGSAVPRNSESQTVGDPCTGEELS